MTTADYSILPRLSKLAFAVLCATQSANALAGFEAYRLQANETIQLDGKLDDSAWSKAKAHTNFYQTQPFDQVKAPVDSEVKIVYDDKHLYVAVRALDPNPTQIHSLFARRDKVFNEQDYIGLFIDPSGNHLAAQVFYVNPQGSINDSIYADTSGDDYSPDFDYEVKTSRFEQGWIAEFKIPFSSINFDPTQLGSWNLLVMRNMMRDTRYRMYSGMVTRATSCNLCVSEPIEGLRDLPTGTQWHATPQWVYRQQKDQVGGMPKTSTSQNELSLDVKVRPSSGSVLDLTWNPDFSQVELDSLQLAGNTRFSLSTAEKRPFFLEGADFFKTPLAAMYTRTISNPAWGARYTQRSENFDFTVLTNADKAGGAVLIPGAYGTQVSNAPIDSQATIARGIWRQGAVVLGAIWSERNYTQGYGYNRMVGVDGGWQRGPNERWRFQVLSSATSARVDAKGNWFKGDVVRGNAATISGSLGSDRYGLNVSATQLSSDFRADNGFFAQAAFRTLAGDYQYKFGRNAWVDELNATFKVERKWDSSGQLMNSDIAPGIWMMGPLDSQISINYVPRKQTRIDANTPLLNQAQWRGSIGFNPWKKIPRLSLDFTVGDIIDAVNARVGKGGSLSLNARMRPIERWEFEPSLALNWIDSKQTQNSGERLYTETALQMNNIVHITSADTLRITAQSRHNRREQRFYDFAVQPHYQRQVASVVYTHDAHSGRAVYLGWSQSEDNAHLADTRKLVSELFVKVSWRL